MQEDKKTGHRVSARSSELAFGKKRASFNGTLLVIGSHVRVTFLIINISLSLLSLSLSFSHKQYPT